MSDWIGVRQASDWIGVRQMSDWIDGRYPRRNEHNPGGGSRI